MQTRIIGAAVGIVIGLSAALVFAAKFQAWRASVRRLVVLIPQLYPAAAASLPSQSLPPLSPLLPYPPPPSLPLSLSLSFSLSLPLPPPASYPPFVLWLVRVHLRFRSQLVTQIPLTYPL